MAVNVESDENAKMFPYRILNDLSKQLKSAEEKIAALLEERESRRCDLKISCGVCNQAVLSESIDEVSTAHRLHGEGVANVDALKEEVCQLQRKVAELIYMNNRYHLSISNCTVCTSEDKFPDASPVTTSLDMEPNILPVPCSGDPSSVEKRKANSVALMHCSKDKTFINRMIRTLAKLETKY